MAAGTLTKVSAYTVSNKRVRVYDYQLSSGANYTTGGETITPQQVGLSRKIEKVEGAMATTTSGTTSRTVVPLYQTNGSVKIVVQTTASAEAASNSDQSTFFVRLSFSGV